MNIKNISFLRAACIAILLAGTLDQGLAQAPQAFEKSLLTDYNRLFSLYQGGESDSLDGRSRLFHQKLFSYLSKSPFTLSYPFKTLTDSNVCYITTSGDGLFRIYSWDTWTGGTMHFFNTVFQFNAGGKVYTKEEVQEEGDPGGFYPEVFTLQANNKTYYLAVENSVFSSKDASQCIKVFGIDNNKLDAVKLIKTQSGLTNILSFGYDFFSVSDRPERPLKLIRYDAVKKTISIPVVYESGKVTDRSILYRFNGQYFEKVQAPKKSK